MFLQCYVHSNRVSFNMLCNLASIKNVSTTEVLACVADGTKPRYSLSANQRPKACSVLPGFSIIGSYWLLHMAVLSCTVIGRVAWNHGYAGSYVLDEYQIHKTNATAITELPGEA